MHLHNNNIYSSLTFLPRLLLFHEGFEQLKGHFPHPHKLRLNVHLARCFLAIQTGLPSSSWVLRRVEENSGAADICKHTIPHSSKHYIFCILMKSRCPRAPRGKNQSIQKITIINASNITINQPFDPKKRNKSVELGKKRMRSPSKQPKESVIIEVEPFDLDEEMRKCRERELGVIRRNVALLKYYNTMICLFMITYNSCQVLASNFFQVRRQAYFFPDLPNQFGVNFLGLLLKVYESVKNYQYEAKLRRLAVNVLKISPTASEFERKAEFISRKVVLNSERMREVEMSFMSLELESFWDRLVEKAFIGTQVEFMEDMFQLEPERLCVKHFQVLLEKYLSCEQFQADLKQYDILKSEETPAISNGHSFSVEFLLIEKLCTEDYDDEEPPREECKQKKKKYNCEIY